MSRPRRSVQPKKYAEMEDSDSEGETKKLGSVSSMDSDAEELSPFEGSEDGSSDISEDLPLFVPAPTEFHAQHTRTLVTEQSARIALLEAKYQAQKRVAEDLEMELKIARQLLFDTQAKIAPVGRIPPELFGLIFTAHVHENQQSPWLLMQVSRAWRAAALMTPRLWGRIILTPPNWIKLKKGGPRVRVIDGMEVCYKQPQLARALKRAGVTPLDVKIVCPYTTTGRRRWGGLTAGNDSEVISLLDYIPQHQANPRLRSLIITSDFWLTIPAGKFEKFNFEALTSLSLEKDYPEIVEKVVSEARGLCNLRIPGSSLQKMKNWNRWSQLDELSITSLGALVENGRVKSILVAATALTSLSLIGGAITGLNENEQIYIPTLTRLDMRAMYPAVWPIDCPNLTRLTYHSPPRAGSRASGSIRLPHLVELSFQAGRYSAENTLRIFDMPSLVTFDFLCPSTKGTTAGIFREIWPSGVGQVSRVEPRIFSLQNTEINQKVLAKTIAGRKDLEEFSTSGVKITTDFFDGILPVMKATKGKGPRNSRSSWLVGCPAMKRMVIDLGGCKLKQDEEVVMESAIALVVARIQAGAPFERFAIRFLKEGDGKSWQPQVNEEQER